MKKAVGILVPLILWVPLLFAQVKFTATVSKTNVGVGEQFEVDFSTNAISNRFTPPDLSAFQILSGPNMSTSETLINRDTTVTNTYSYILAPTKEGTFNVDAATIVINGHKLSSNSLEINVKGRLSAARQAQQQVKVADPLAAENNGAYFEPNSKNLAKRIFISVDADKTHARVGEQITITYKLYTRVSIAGGQVEKDSALKGFREQKVLHPGGQKNVWTTENVNDMKYSVTTIWQRVVFPEHTGDLMIAPLSMITILQIPVKGHFDNPFGNYQQLKYEIKSAPIIIHVKARPSKPAKAT